MEPSRAALLQAGGVCSVPVHSQEHEPAWRRWPPALFPQRVSEFLCPAWFYFLTTKGRVRVEILYSSDMLGPHDLKWAAPPIIPYTAIYSSQ